MKTRLRSWWHALELDSALADGVDPLATDELIARAESLVRPDTRLGFARSLRELVAIAERPRARIFGGPEAFAREQIRCNRSPLLALASRLEEQGLQCLRGLAMTSVLLQDGRSPLHRARAPVELEEEIELALVALDPEA